MEKRKNRDRQTADRVYTIGLEDMEFVGFHGCREDEKLNGNIFNVDFVGRYWSIAGSTDKLEDTINYGRIYALIAQVMHAERCNLLETLAQRIVDAVSGEFGDRMLDFSVCVSKKNPPVAGPCSWSRIELEWSADE